MRSLSNAAGFSVELCGCVTAGRPPWNGFRGGWSCGWRQLLPEKSGVAAEVFTAMDDIQALLSGERRVMDVLRDLLKAEQQKLEFIERYF